MIKLQEELEGLYEGKPIKIRVSVCKRKKTWWLLEYLPFLKYCFNGEYEDFE